jgi:menaquinone-9 beta-reductase
MATSFDVCIVGAGPAGCAAAVTATRNGRRVLLVDKDTFPRHKVCGEFVSFESVSLLTDLLGQRIAGVPLASVRLFRNRHVQQAALPATALSVSRFELDHQLLCAAERSGASIMTGERVKQIDKDANGFLISTARDSYRADRVINAAGRWSEFRLPPKVSLRPWIGIKQHFHEPSPHHSTDLYFFPGGYCGVQPIASDRINVCALVEVRSATTMDSMLALSSALHERARTWQPLTGPIATAPIIFGPPRPIANDMFNVGDAAAFIDPFLGDGISIALQTGTLAAECLQQRNGLERYEREYRRRVAPALSRAARLRSLSHSGLAWKALRLPGALDLAARLTRIRAA